MTLCVNRDGRLHHLAHSIGSKTFKVKHAKSVICIRRIYKESNATFISLLQGHVYTKTHKRISYKVKDLLFVACHYWSASVQTSPVLAQSVVNVSARPLGEISKMNRTKSTTICFYSVRV
jgi:hypothetical protein